MTDAISLPWYQQAIFYHIYPLGLCGAPPRSADEAETVNRLGQLIDWIPHLQSMQVNAVYLGPVQAAESHGYDPVDYYQVDHRLGSTEDLQQLMQAFHEAGIRVIFDAVLNHVGREFFAFQDVLAKGQDSQYCGWFYNLDFEGESPAGDPFSYEGWSGHYNLVKLDLRHPEVIEHLLSAVKHWIEDFGVDGLRLDAANVMDADFLKMLAASTREWKDDFWLMGEMVEGDHRKLANPEMLHATTNYECYKGLYSSHNDANYFEIAHSLQRLFNTEDGIYKNLHLYNFADNHDVTRVASILNVKPHVYPLYLLMYTMPGAPSIYYGSEWGIAGEKQPESDDELRPCIPAAWIQGEKLDPLPEQMLTPDLFPALQRFGAVRQQSQALQMGAYTQVHVASQQLAFVRSLALPEQLPESVLVVLNAHDAEVELSFNLEGLLSGDVGEAVDLLNEESFALAGTVLSLKVPPHWGRVLRI